MTGPMYYKGVYHLFYQYNPDGATFGHDQMVWAHSVSYDLINWIHLNNALVPSEPYDINSCFSGSATILPGEKPVMLYTGITDNRHQVQSLATPKNLSDPFLREWVKHPQNPVMIPPSGVEVNNFRDPSTAWLGKDGKWRVIMGAQNGDQGKLILYQSEDFINWKEGPNPFFATDNTGVCECPDFFPVSIHGRNGVDTSVQNPSVRHVTKTSYLTRQRDYYFLGKYVDDQDLFIPDTYFTGTSLDLRFDYGRFYASKTFFDPQKDRRILWGWVKEADTKQDDIDKGWAGLQTIPRQVWLDESGKKLIQWPIEEVEKRRGEHISINGEKLVSGSRIEVSGITASQADVEVIFEVPELESAELIESDRIDPQLLCSKEYALTSGVIGPFVTREGLLCGTILKKGHMELSLHPKLKTISLRVLIDHSIIESFGDEGRVCITSRVYPSLAIGKDAHLFVFNNGTQSISVSKLNAWSMKKAQINDEQTLK
ncbi:hypothetical protein L6164_002237 [Bauhinia variegata]|uniref:Uncharacterized protein n=1 Tax=Bauhinia variegata TaxID=167791 RepID=A0ACB9PZ25_BAUVA|nr:hypothetical protein L6164_002237 [Bauhinia variegata]